MRPIFSFGHQPVFGEVKSGLVIACDLSIQKLQVVFEDGSKEWVTLAARDCSEDLSAIVSSGDDTVELRANVQLGDGGVGEVVAIFLVVDDVKIISMLENGELRCEEHMIRLIRSFWRDGRIPREPAPSAPAPMAIDDGDPVLKGWSASAPPLYEHQSRSVAWMREMEASFPMRLSYAGNIHVAGEWYVDTETEQFSRDPSMREGQLVGGVCADGLGKGKTAVVLRVIAETLGSAAAVRGGYAGNTLIVVPLNLVAQWRAELSKFLDAENVRKLFLLQIRDLRDVTIETIGSADLVLTTFEFLRSAPYARVVDAALDHRARERSVLSAWARRPGQTAPVLEALEWHRVVVDELHQVFDAPRDLRLLRLFRTKALWGLSATVDVDSERAQHLYVLLAREKAHHPVLLKELVNTAVHSSCESDANVSDAPQTVSAVRLTSEERVRLLEYGDDDETAPSLAQQIQRQSLPSLAAGMADGGAPAPAPARELQLLTLRAKAEAHERSVRILEKAERELETELTRLTALCVDGDEAAAAQAEVTRAAFHSQSKDLAAARRLHTAALSRLARYEAQLRLVDTRIDELRADAACAACGVGPRELILSPCMHSLCARCCAGDACARCGAPVERVTAVARSRTGVGSKMHAIAALLNELANAGPVLLFVQWKAMVRPVREFLKARQLAVHLLDGNSAQRAHVLQSLDAGGVLLLCLEESFAGLHLPNVANVIFAHALVGEVAQIRRLEAQAVARCLRQGQTRDVRVYSFVVADTDEETKYKASHHGQHV